MPLRDTLPSAPPPSGLSSSPFDGQYTNHPASFENGVVSVSSEANAQRNAPISGDELRSRENTAALYTAIGRQYTGTVSTSDAKSLANHGSTVSSFESSSQSVPHALSPTSKIMTSLDVPTVYDAASRAEPPPPYSSKPQTVATLSLISAPTLRFRGVGVESTAMSPHMHLLNSEVKGSPSQLSVGLAGVPTSLDATQSTGSLEITPLSTAEQLSSDNIADRYVDALGAPAPNSSLALSRSLSKGLVQAHALFPSGGQVSSSAHSNMLHSAPVLNSIPLSTAPVGLGENSSTQAVAQTKLNTSSISTDALMDVVPVQNLQMIEDLMYAEQLDAPLDSASNIVMNNGNGAIESRRQSMSLSRVSQGSHHLATSSAMDEQLLFPLPATDDCSSTNPLRGTDQVCDATSIYDQAVDVQQAHLNDIAHSRRTSLSLTGPAQTQSIHTFSAHPRADAITASTQPRVDTDRDPTQWHLDSVRDPTQSQIAFTQPQHDTVSMPELNTANSVELHSNSFALPHLPDATPILSQRQSYNSLLGSRSASFGASGAPLPSSALDLVRRMSSNSDSSMRMVFAEKTSDDVLSDAHGLTIGKLPSSNSYSNLSNSMAGELENIVRLYFLGRSCRACSFLQTLNLILFVLYLQCVAFRGF